MTQVVIPNNFVRVLKKKERRLQEAILECIKRLEEDPARPGLRVHKMRGVPGVWEAYVDRANRVTFSWQGDTLILRNNCNHDILTRNP